MDVREGVTSFCVYSVLGWVADSLVRSAFAGEWTADNGLGVPFSPLYGVGAFVALFLARRIAHWA
ncbi:MAG: hypothetical protein GY913_27630 [Proteobacteria bacterium]|nr:hypothetical protein [Pseudomonadota bacterium]MCP4920687.1 hypothetical protein [Pseudomonadota bacterium]